MRYSPEFMPENYSAPSFESEPSPEAAPETPEYSQHELIVPDDELRKAEQVVAELGLFCQKRQSRAREPLGDSGWVPGEYTLSIFHDAENSELISREMTSQVLQAMLTANVTARRAELGKGDKEASDSEAETGA
jgi:hypothetical protein